MKSILKRNRVLAVIALIGLLASLVPPILGGGGGGAKHK